MSKSQRLWLCVLQRESINKFQELDIWELESGKEFWLGVESTVVESRLLRCAFDDAQLGFKISGNFWGGDKKPETKNNWVRFKHVLRQLCKAELCRGCLEWNGLDH